MREGGRREEGGWEGGGRVGGRERGREGEGEGGREGGRESGGTCMLTFSVSFPGHRWQVLCRVGLLLSDIQVPGGTRFGGTTCVV